MRKKKMIKLLLACGLLMSPVTGHAASEPKVVISTTSGATYEIFIADNPKMTYQDNLLVCQNDKGLTVSVEAADVKTFRFVPSDNATCIRTADAARSGSVLSGLKAGSRVDVFGLDGKLVKSLKANEEGTAEIDFGQLPQGILVIKTEKGSLKIKH